MLTYEEFKSTFNKLQKDLEKFDSWFVKVQSKGLTSFENKYNYIRELDKFLTSNKLFLDDRGKSRVRFRSQAEFAFGLILEYLLKMTDYTTQTYIFKEFDFFIPRLHLIVEIDGKHHYIDSKVREITFKKISGVLQECRLLQRDGFKIYRYLSDEIYFHTNNNKSPKLDPKFLDTFINDILNLLQNDDSLEHIKLIRDYSVKLEAERSKK